MSKKVVITLQNPLQVDDLFDMTFTVNENEISHDETGEKFLLVGDA